MPVLERVVENNLALQLGMRPVTEYPRSATRWWLGEKLFTQLEGLEGGDRQSKLANRQGFEVYLEQEWRRMARDQAPLSIILCDINFFWGDNNSQPEKASQECLLKVAEAIAKAVKRPADLVAHYDGEKFAILLPNTPTEGALCVAEQIIAQVSKLKISQTNAQLTSSLTLSVGVAGMIPSYEYSPSMLMSAASQALYQAKLQGGNQVILHEKLLRQTQLVEL